MRHKQFRVNKYTKKSLQLIISTILFLQKLTLVNITFTRICSRTLLMPNFVVHAIQHAVLPKIASPKPFFDATVFYVICTVEPTVYFYPANLFSHSLTYNKTLSSFLLSRWFSHIIKPKNTPTHTLDLLWIRNQRRKKKCRG